MGQSPTGELTLPDDWAADANLDTEGDVICALTGQARAEFLSRQFTREPLHNLRGAVPGILTSLPHADDLARLLPLFAQRTDLVSVSRNGDTLPARRLSAGGGLDLQAIWSDFHDGASVVVNSLHLVDTGVKSLCDQLFAATGHALQANGYLTPPASSALSTHYDTHDVFVVQLSGSKHWRLFEPPTQLPLFPGRRSPRLSSDDLESRPWASITLREGEVLYVPRGWPHSVTSADSVSFHITFGLNVISVADALRVLLDIAEAEESELRRPLSYDLFKPLDISIDLGPQLARLMTLVERPSVRDRVLTAIRKRHLSEAGIAPRPLFNRVRPRIRWRHDAYYEDSATEDGDLILSNGVKMTLVKTLDLPLLQRLRKGEYVEWPAEASDGFLSRLIALGLIEASDASSNG